MSGPRRTSRGGPLRRPGRRLPRRLVQLYAGLVLLGASIGLLVRGRLGVMPWDVLHQGIARHTGLSLGTVTIALGVLLLLCWVPLRQRPGVGTLSNALVVGLAADATLGLLPQVDELGVRVGLVVVGVGVNAVATAAYIGSRLGPGPRDGLMTGLVHRAGVSVRVVRTAMEVVVVVTGIALGGTFGPATVAYALLVGPLVQPLLGRLTVAEPVTLDDRALDASASV